MTGKYAPIVQLDKGLVRGIVQEVDDSHIYVYQGFRYARANRFEKAQPVEPWTGVYDATTFSPNPPQLGLEQPHRGHHFYDISEDCLMLNVWQPIRESSAPRPVMVYIFGGKFQVGSMFAVTNDLRWIAHRGDVIAVEMNYRLGPFGFMFGDDREAPANLGLHDIILALRWVQENICKFGGNPNLVTLFGNSSGSMTVGALILSPLTRGLFHRAMLQSGDPLRFEHKDKKVHIIRSIAQQLNCDNSDMSALVGGLKSKSIQDILNATQELKIGFELVYGDEILPLRPVDVLISGNYNTDIDLMYGTARDEGAVFVLDAFPEVKNEQFELTLQSSREYIHKMIHEPKLANETADFYINARGLNEQSCQEDFRQLLYQVFGDYTFGGVILFGEIHAKHSTVLGKHKTFAWLLAQPADVHIVKLTAPTLVCHADELFYLFTIKRQRKPEDIKLSHELIQAWTQFARNGDPGTVGNERWKVAVDSDKADYTTRLIALGYESKMVTGMHKEMVNFWRDRLFKATNANFTEK